jgi:hypothetical protein
VPVAAPCDHVIVPAQPLAVRFKVEGVQTDEAEVKVMVGAAGLALISKPFTILLAPLGQPFTVQVAVIEYVPTAEIVKLVPVAVFDQVTVPAQPLAVRFKVEGSQTINAVVAPIVGAAGVCFISKPPTTLLTSEVQPLSEQVAVIE